MSKKLWYKEPANKWVDGLPLGNGSLGAMVFGEVINERIALNEDKLWTGTKSDKVNKNAKNFIDTARRLIDLEEYYTAQDIINKSMLSGYTESYAPLGNLYLDFYYKDIKDENEDDYNKFNSNYNKEPIKYKDYRRELNLENATVNISYKINSVEFKREIFTSAKDKVMVMRIISNERENISFDARLNSLLKSESFKYKEDGLCLRGIAPIENLPSYVDNSTIIYDEEGKEGIKFCSFLKVKTEDGSININNNVLEVRNSSEVVLILSASTNFENFNTKPGELGKDEEEISKDIIGKAYRLSYKELYENHINDYKALFDRVEFKLSKEEDLDNSKEEAFSTDERLKKFKNGYEDLDLIALYFHYGRYLLISSSREGSQPANLQGIWNEDIKPAWSSNYTININTEMNYWPAEVCNLPECHMPLLNMIKELSVTGKITAKEEFNCNGWTANHNTDIWRYSNTVLGSCEWGYWPMGASWLCHHIYEHYKFTKDKEFLEEYYNVIKENAIFILDWLIEDENGVLNTCPSTSPENKFLDKKGRPCAVSKSSTMDIAIIRNLFENTIELIEELEKFILTSEKEVVMRLISKYENEKHSINTINQDITNNYHKYLCEYLDEERNFRNNLEVAIKKLPKYKINKNGCIQEWYKDFEEYEPGHRHISHLFGLYPGKDINNSNKELIEACKKTLERRLSEGGGHTGWSCAWIINFYARLKDGESAYKYLKVLLKNLTYPNLFCVHPPFQIDGNFGGIAAIAEMLVQSHNDTVELLPAIPKAWLHGEVRGLKTRQGETINIKW